jgi:cytochrome P450
MGQEFGFATRSLWEYAEFYIEALVALVVAWSFFIFINRNKLRRLLPPGPFPLPVIGNLHLLGKLPHQALAALSLKYGPLMSLRLGSSALTLVLSSGDIAEEFLKTHDRHFASRHSSAAIKYLTYNFSGVAFAPYGPYWRQMRKVCVLQLLSSRRIDSFSFIREEEVSAMILSIINSNSDHPQDDSRPLNIRKTVSALTNAIICKMAFGRKYSDEDVIGSIGFDSLIKEILLLAGSFNIGDYIPYLAWMDHLRGLNRRLKNVHNTKDQFLEKVIEEHELNAQNDPNVPRDLVDVLLAASAENDMELQITRDNIKAVLFDMLVGGMDTSSTSIEWAMSEVLKNPRVLQKLQDELARVVGMERMVCESDLPRLVYLQAVVKETLRLHPVVPFPIHLSLEDCTVLGYEIPINTRIFFNLWAIGRNPKSWGQDAQSFKPERFLIEAEAGLIHKTHESFEWLPFGAGRRGCPGQQLGTLVVELAVAQLLHCFNWRLPLNEQELDMTEMFNGLTLPRAHELFALPTPRLPVL